MAAVTIAQMLEAEAAAINDGWTEERLLNLAGECLGHAIGRHFPSPGTAIGYLGKGHNAGDTLVALRILRDHYNWQVAYRNALPLEQLAPLAAKKADELGYQYALNHPPTPSQSALPIILLDGLLGTGAHGAIRSPLDQLAAEMTQLRETVGAKTVAVDLPSGINADTGDSHQTTIKADITFMIGNAKRGLLNTKAANHTGALALVPVEPLTCHFNTSTELISPQTQNFSKKPRPYDFHKGMAGRVSILAGSSSFSGAAALAALGALRGGAGLITLHVPEEIRDAVASRCPAEIIIQGYREIADINDANADARVVGCGLGDLSSDQTHQLFDWISSSQQPTVLDADALNLIAKHDRFDLLMKHHVLTPHPGEFQRLSPNTAETTPEDRCRLFTDQFPATLLLKGCRTLISQQGTELLVNSTGSPGMATGGQGDLLAGVIASQLAAGLSCPQAASLSAWLCGRAAEIALLSQPNLSEESLTPTDVAKHLGGAHRDWKQASR